MSILSPAFAPSYPEVDRNCKKKTRDFVPIVSAYFSSSSFSAREVTLMSLEPVFIVKFTAIRSPRTSDPAGGGAARPRPVVPTGPF